MKTFLILFLATLPLLGQQILTLEQCYELAIQNYPLTQQTKLLEEKSKIEVQAMEKEKLPQIHFNAQATYQSDVISLPLELPNANLEPPNKDQYRATLDVNQLIYDGGRIGAETNLKKAELQTQKQQVAVTLYTLKMRVNQNYFNVLLHQEQIRLLQSKREQLQARLKEIDVGVKQGAVLLSASQLLQAEILKLDQQLAEADYNRKKALGNLELLLSQKLENNTMLTQPEILVMEDFTSHRPELELFDLQQNQLETSKELLSKANYPRLSGFAQAGYGNPGLNMLDNSFQDFYMIGLKLSWNLFDWNKMKDRIQVVDISKEMIAAEKETFVLNNQMQLKEAQTEIDKYDEILQKDKEIIRLREEVMKSVTSQFKYGTITPAQYLVELNNMYDAKIMQELHRTQLVLAKANFKVIKGE